MTNTESNPKSNDAGRTPYSTELYDLATDFNNSRNAVRAKEILIGRLVTSRNQLTGERPELEEKMSDSILENAFLRDESSPAEDANMDRSAERLGDVNEGLLAIDGLLAAKRAEREAAIAHADQAERQLDTLPTNPPHTPSA